MRRDRGRVRKRLIVHTAAPTVDRLVLKTMPNEIVKGADIRRQSRNRLPNALKTTRSTFSRTALHARLRHSKPQACA
jgi:hypothetical protein